MDGGNGYPEEDGKWAFLKNNENHEHRLCIIIGVFIGIIGIFIGIVIKGVIL